MADDKYEYSAEATFRGFRAQTLYILYRLIKDKENFKFRLEGKEDLDIYFDDDLLELIQVKCYYSHNLKLSDLEPEKKSSFLRRSVERLKIGLNPEITLISFGTIGNELEIAFKSDGDDSKIRTKLLRKGYENSEIDLIFENIKLVKVNERNLEQEIYDYLKTTLVGFDPNTAFDLLMYWLYNLSERSESVYKLDLHDKMDNIASILRRYSGFLEEYGLSVKKLELVEEAHALERLEEEFYVGISARYEHILADLDVRRYDKLNEIKENLEHNNVLIIHGASGQGKSTLAYRFLRDYYPDSLTYQIESKERDPLRIINTLHAISKSIDDQIAIFIDIEPSDTVWIDIVKELARYPKFKVLAAIREEDWKRATLSGADLTYSEIELSFNKEEAEKIYENITLKKPNKEFLDFEDSWSKFGGDGPLLEFTYLLNQGETLRARLEQQIDRIRDEASKLGEIERLELLRIVSIIGMYGCKADLISLLSTIKLKDPVYIIKIFQKEYLLREESNGKYIGALHPIRAKILVGVLSDPYLRPIEDDLGICISVIDEKDFEIFLLNCFLEYGAHEKILGPLQEHIPISWTGYGLIIKSLLWLGIKNYVELNSAVIDEAHEKFHSGWNLMLLTDLSDSMEGKFVDPIENVLFSEDIREQAKSFRSRLFDKSIIYEYVTQWLTNSVIPSESPEGNNEFENLGFSLFWFGRLRIKKNIDFSKFDFDRYFDSISLDSIADFIIGLYNFDSKGVIIKEYRPKIIERFKKELIVPLIEDNDEKIMLHCIIDVTEFSKSSPQSENYVHELIMERISLIRKYYPEKKVFACKGYGHDVSILKSDLDETKKEISIENLPLDWLTRINATFGALTDYNYRPDSWEDYVLNVVKTREESLNVIKILLKNLKKYFKTRKNVNIATLNHLSDYWDDLAQNLDIITFPKVAVDPWGFTSENLQNTIFKEEEQKMIQSVNLNKFRTYYKFYWDFISCLNNFYHQGTNVIELQLLTKGKKPTDIEIIKKNLEKKGVKDFNRLSVLNFHDAYKNLLKFQIDFDNHFRKYLSIDKLESSELTYYGILAEVWNIFALKKFEFDKNIIKNAKNNFYNGRENIFREVIKTLEKKNLKLEVISKSVNNKIENYLIFNVDNPFKIDETANMVYNSLKNRFNGIQPTDLKKLFLDLEFPYFRCIILVRGKLLLPISYNLPLFRILSPGNNNMDIIDLNPKSLEGIELDIENWNDEIPEINELNNIFKLEELQQLIYHLKQLVDLDLDDLGFEIAQEHANKVSRTISKDFQIVLDFLTFAEKLLSKDINNLKEKFDKKLINSDKFSNEIEKSKEIFELFKKIHEKFIIGKVDDSGKIDVSIKLKDIDEWYNKIQESKDNIYRIYLYFANQLILEYNK